MLPYLAQGESLFLPNVTNKSLRTDVSGSNSAIEDGAVLGGLLGNLRSKSQLPQALKIFQHLRKERGEAIATESFQQVRCSSQFSIRED